jgi:hypothetical protein
MRHNITTLLVLGIGTLMFSPMCALAYPLDFPDPWHPWVPPGQEPPEGLPDLPPSGHYMVDSPAAEYYDWKNAGDSFMARMRGGGTAYLVDYEGYPYDDDWISTGFFRDAHEYYGWDYQVMPLGNGTILDVSLIVNLTTPNLPSYHVGLQYSLDSQATWEPDFSSHPEYMFDVDSSVHWKTYGFNVTAMETWTPQNLMGSQLFVRLWTDDHIWSGIELCVDYIGLRYNWTTNPSAPSQPIDTWENSTLAHMSMGQLIPGGIGMIGFIGMIVVPPLTVYMAKRSDERILTGVKGFAAFTFCFGIFLAAIM